MENRGIDGGYTFTKSDTHVIFPSRITQVEPLLGHGRTLRYRDTLYYIGTGNTTVSTNKIDETITTVLLLYALCASLAGDRCRLVTGLPIGQYKPQRDALRTTLLKKLQFNRVEYDGHERAIAVEDVAIYPQGLLPYDEDYVSVDIGGCTVDVAYVVGGEIIYSKTLYCGMRSLHGRIMDLVNAKYETRLPDDYAHKILTEGLTVHGRPEDISFLFPVYQEHVEAITDNVREFCPPRLVPIYITGGGNGILFDSIKKRLPAAQLVENGQFSNAEMFKLWGDELWA